MNTRRIFSAAFKAKVVLASLTGAKSQAELCREHQLSPALLAHWRQEFVEHASMIFERAEARSDEASRVADLERMLGRVSLELDISKKASALLPSLNGGVSSRK